MLEEIIRAGIVLPAPEPEPALPPAVPPRNNPDLSGHGRDGIYPAQSGTAVPEANKELWNYMGSPTLLEAVEDGAVSQIEAEVVMEIGSYRHSVNYTALAVGISPVPNEVAYYGYSSGSRSSSSWASAFGKRVDELYTSGIIKLRKWLSK